MNEKHKRHIKRIAGIIAVAVVPGSFVAVIGYFIWNLIRGYFKRSSKPAT